MESLVQTVSELGESDVIRDGSIPKCNAHYDSAVHMVPAFHTYVGWTNCTAYNCTVVVAPWLHTKHSLPSVRPPCL